MSMNYDILITPSTKSLDSNIVDSLQAISATAPSVDPDCCSGRDSSYSSHGAVPPPASIQSNITVRPHQVSAPLSRHQRGLTLVELMIAMLLGLFLLGGLLQIFISSKQTYRMQEGLSRLQENGRFAIDFMTRDIRLAGYKGCGSRSYPAMPPILNNATDFLYDFNKAIQGFEASTTTAWSPAMVSDITLPLGGSDVITIRRADEQGFSVATHPSNNASLTLDATSASIGNLKAAGFLASSSTTTAPVNNCAIAVVSNCASAAVFQITAITGNDLEHSAGTCTSGSSTVPPGNADPSLKNTYSGGQVFPINTISYFVRTTPVKTDPATITSDVQLSLYRRIGANDAQELVEGVERMEILYGVDMNAEGTAGYGTADYYVNAKEVNDADNWAKVVSVRISLLVATIDDNLTAQPAVVFSFNGQNTPADRKLRRVFTSTVALRNRLL